MKRILLTVLIMTTIAGSANAMQTSFSNGDSTGYSNSGSQVKFYDQYGSLKGYAKNQGKGQVVTYDKYHQRNGRYQVSKNGKKVKKYNRAGH